ncbi:hypothetical protein GQ457_11G003700 [Hibiscus cannabinus]
MEPSSHCDSWRPPYPVPHHHQPMIHHHHHHTTSCPLHHHHHHTISCHLHHHHHHHTISCPVHHHLITCHSHVSPTLAPLSPQNHANLESTTAQNEAHHSGNPLLQDQEYEELQDIKEEEDEEEEPIFVLTDEWREFFAKSEAKRKLEKKQAKKKQKN